MRKVTFSVQRVLAMLVFFLIMVTFSLIALNMVSAADTSGLVKDGRWFKYNGEYPYFVGYDYQELFAKKSFSYTDIDNKLNALQNYRVNKVRVWADCWFLGSDGYYPWTVDANGKKNLDSWDTTYWTRMKDFVQKCKDRDIIVEVTIFSPYPDDFNGWWTNTTWKTAWNKAFNNNNAFTSNANGNFWPQFFDPNYTETSSSGKTLQQYQTALIDKCIDELKGYGNVYFEVCNEFPGRWDSGNAINTAYPWQQSRASYMHNIKGAITTCHSNEGSTMNSYGINYFKNQPYVDVLNFHFYATDSDSPNDISNFLRNNGLQTTGKIIQCNESSKYETYTDACTREAWGTFVSGGYYFHYCEDVDTIGDSAWNTRAERLKTLRNIAETVSFWQMSPVDGSGNEYDSLVTAGPGPYRQVLANPGSEYVVYFCGTKSTTSTSISLPSGTYSYKYYDTRTWNSNGLLSGTVNSSGGATSIPAPATSGWTAATGLALVIKSTATSTPTPGESTIVDDRDGAITYYSAAWDQTTEAGAYNSTISCSNKTGYYAQLTFTGTSVSLYSKKGPGGGYSDIYLDGQLVATFDGYNATAQYQVLAYQNNSLSSGQHTIKIQVKGIKNPSSSGYYVNLDYIEYSGSTATPTPTPTPGGTNLVTNPGFESGTTSWYWDPAWTRVTSDKYTGSYSAKCTGTGVWDQLSQNNISVTTNTDYTFTFWGKCSSTGLKYKVIRVSDGYVIAQGNSIGNNVWTQYVLNFNSGTATQVKLYFGDGGGTHYVDDVSLTPN